MKRIYKPKLEETTKHALDKKVYERELGKEIHKDFYDSYDPDICHIPILEDRYLGTVGMDISTKPISIVDQNIFVEDHYVPVRTYQAANKTKNVIYYIHGGGFVGGSIESKDNQCKYMAQTCGADVVSIGYRLAPETMFPGALKDCMGVLNWLQTLDYEHIIIAGDSAGGNLAACCMAQDTNHCIDYGVLIYAALDVETYDQTPYHWDYSMYEMADKHKDRIMNRLYRFRNLAIDMKKLYVPEGMDVKNPEISPLYAEPSLFPPILMIEAEFDYYRVCNELFEKKLKNVETIYYEGLDHGFFDRIGQLEQAKDCIDEIGNRIKKYF